MSLLFLSVGLLCGLLIGVGVGEHQAEERIRDRLAAEWEDGYEWGLADARGEVVHLPPRERTP